VNGLQIQSLGDDRFLLSGDLHFDNVPQIWEESRAMFTRAPGLTLDLSGITRTDSAGLALLIEWMRLARESRKPIAFKNVPAQMQALIEASGLTEVLPLS
jgi:phospholipid transport system transporter-binding protein